MPTSSSRPITGSMHAATVFKHEGVSDITIGYWVESGYATLDLNAVTCQHCLEYIHA